MHRKVTVPYLTYPVSIEVFTLFIQSSDDVVYIVGEEPSAVQNGGQHGSYGSTGHCLIVWVFVHLRAGKDYESVLQGWNIEFSNFTTCLTRGNEEPENIQWLSSKIRRIRISVVCHLSQKPLWPTDWHWASQGRTVSRVRPDALAHLQSSINDFCQSQAVAMETTATNDGCVCPVIGRRGTKIIVS